MSELYKSFVFGAGGVGPRAYPKSFSQLKSASDGLKSLKRLATNLWVHLLTVQQFHLHQEGRL